MLATSGVAGFGEYRDLHPDVADALVREVVKQQEARAEANTAMATEILKVIMQGFMMVAKTVAARPTL